MRPNPRAVAPLVLLLLLGAAPAPEKGTDAAYIPGLGDLMTAGVQPRHVKLWFAGRDRNWPLATYELGELKEALGDVRRLQPRWDGFEIGPMIDKATTAPLADIEAAIKTENEPAFELAFAHLSKGCNACHQEAGHPYLVIRVPGTSPFPDQDFRPQRH